MACIVLWKLMQHSKTEWFCVKKGWLPKVRNITTVGKLCVAYSYIDRDNKMLSEKYSKCIPEHSIQSTKYCMVIRNTMSGARDIISEQGWYHNMQIIYISKHFFNNLLDCIYLTSNNVIVLIGHCKALAKSTKDIRKRKHKNKVWIQWYLSQANLTIRQSFFM